MSGWDGLSLEALRSELDTYAGGPLCPASEGWRTVDELAAQYGINRHTISMMIKTLMEHGRVERGERLGRRVDGVRCRQIVYRLVDGA